MDDLFYLIWRNSYIRRLIRNIKCRDSVIHVTNQYLLDNHQYLSFTKQDKVDYNISIRSDIYFQDYLNNQHKYIINELNLQRDEDLLPEMEFDFNQIHDGVTKLTMSIKEGQTGAGQLPNSLTYLWINIYGRRESRAISMIVNHVLSNISSNLKTLVLPDVYLDSGNYTIPDSLTDLSYGSKYDNLQRLVVSPNKVFQNCILDVDTIESVQWLEENKWINNIVIDSRVAFTENTCIPSHVSKIRVKGGGNIQNCVLPTMLESLTCFYGTPFSHFEHLKSLFLYSYPVMLEKGVLPLTLQELNLSYDQPLDVDVLPPQLTTLGMYEFNQPLFIGVLPPHLTTLGMYGFNQLLFPGVLPNSITELYLLSFNQPLSSDVLPNMLKVLTMDGFKQPTIPPLPTSLLKLSLRNFKGTSNVTS
ncbi:hypothetical protein CYY_001881 [Polysphondylium violaceum]|uniref:FNIP repeat-containing protein n=1 Tax=Polysphondylium violaceum TaxID=133409 RepID=A0A8J4Q100_9MYCE|nr:hypothetical protein CYY_001881 [Polysphondylium violaceum]